MTEFKKKGLKSIFGFTEVQNRIATNTVKMIIGDIITLYEEFSKIEGPGALFFNPTNPDASKYLNIPDLRKDIVLAEELMDDNLVRFLSKLINIIEKNGNSESPKPVVVMVGEEGMTAHMIDLNEVEKHIKEFVADASS